MRYGRKKQATKRKERCVHQTDHRRNAGRKGAVAQPSRSVKDERLRRACGILDRSRRLSSAEVKSLRGKLCQSELPGSSMGCSQSPFAFRQSRTRP